MSESASATEPHADTANLHLRLLGEDRTVSVPVPLGRRTLLDLLPAARAVTEQAVAVAVDRARAQGRPASCRVGCGACCIAPSISSPIPGMPAGKAAGVRCVQLSPDNRCLIFGRPERPAVCVELRPSADMCGDSAEDAMRTLARLERATARRPLTS